MDPEVATISKQTEIPVSEIPPSKTHHPFRKMPLLLSFLFVFFVIGAFFAGTYYQGMNTKKEAAKVAAVSPTPSQPTPTIDPTADWKTYIFPKSSISFKYPSTYLLGSEFGTGIWEGVSFATSEKDVEGLKECYEPGQKPTCEKYSLQVDVVTSLKSEYPTLSDFINANVPTSPTLFRPFSFVGHDAVRLDQEDKESNIAMTLVFLTLDKEYVYIDLSSTQPDANKQYFDQILKTFTLTTPSQTDNMADWKTYSSSYEGASFQYPPDWKLTVSKNFEVNAENVTLQSPDGLMLSFNPYVSGLGGGCDPSNCPLVKTRSVTKLPNANSKEDLYLVEGTSNQEKRLGIMSARANTQLPTVGEKKAFPYYLVFTSRKDDIAAFMLYDEYKENSGRKYDEVPEEAFFSRSDVQVARQILSSLKYR